MSLKEKLKVRFTIHIIKGSNIPKGAKTVFIEWRRGSRRRTGKSKTVDVIGTDATLNDDFIVETKIETSGELDRNQTLEARNFQEKKMSLSIKEGKKSGLMKSYRSIGKTYFNLSEYIRGDNSPTQVTKVLSSKASKDGKEPTLTFSIKSELLKLGRVTLTPVRDPATVQATPRSTINLGGTNYAVRPEESHTETTLDSDSDSVGAEDFREEDDDDPSFSSPKPNVTDKPTVAAVAGSGSSALSSEPPQRLHQRSTSSSSSQTPSSTQNSSNSLPTQKTSSNPSTSSNNTAAASSSSSTTPSAPKYQYSYSEYTPPSEKKYSHFGERPLQHKILC